MIMKKKLKEKKKRKFKTFIYSWNAYMVKKKKAFFQNQTEELVTEK